MATISVAGTTEILPAISAISKHVMCPCPVQCAIAIAHAFMEPSPYIATKRSFRACKDGGSWCCHVYLCILGESKKNTLPPPCKLPPLAISPPCPRDRHFHVFLVNMYCAGLCRPSALRMALHCFPITTTEHVQQFKVC